MSDRNDAWGKSALQHAQDEKMKRRAVAKKLRERHRELMHAHRAGETADKLFVPVAAVRALDDNWHLRIKRKADDTRNLTSRWQGDPRPGQSALDRR